MLRLYCAVALMAAAMSGVNGFYLPGVNPQSFKKGDV